MAKPRALASVLLCAWFTAGAAFFAYYTARLAWVNLTAPEISGDRQLGMYIGAVSFPLATAAFGGFAILCARAVNRVQSGGRP